MSQPNPPPLPNLSPPPKAHMLHRDAQIPSPPCSSTAPTLPGTPRSTTPPTTAPPPILVPALAVRRDIRSRMPSPIARFLGHRPHGAKPPFKPLPFPPFSWLRHMPLKYEVWLLSCIGAFVSIALIEAVMASAGGFADTDTVLITASFGASAVLTFATIDSPLAQPLHLVGGQVVCAVVGVCVTRLFHLAPGYTVPLETTHVGDLHQLVWINGALSMALAVVAMQATGTVHPPGGATALIASVQPAVIAMSWRYIYIVLISALLMLGWAMVINNVGRRRYPAYWFHGTHVFVHAKPKDREETEDDVQMAAVEGRNAGFAAMERALSRSWDGSNEASPQESRRGSSFGGRRIQSMV